jgi:hypothetical protein
MTRIGTTLRILAILLCLVPFTSARQASGAFAPCPAATPSPGNETPAPPAEEEDERETASAKERLLAHSRHRPLARQQIDMLPLPRASHAPPAPQRPTSPCDADPFRNGLGSPYRC